MTRHLNGLVLIPLAALALAGCQETTTVARQRVDAPGVPVSVQSISGAPDSVTTNFASLLGEAAAERKMEIVAGDKPARFRVRGYLTAQPTVDGQTSLAFVWDVYDESKKRAQRVQGESFGRSGGGADPWSGIDQTVVAKAASESMDAIAGFLVTTPAVETVNPGDKTKAAGTKTAAAATGKRL
ncbi:hypothetical protein [Bosea sp. PAMC 26642]|uniref:hypothetical protein n=1 Tax=Bosea sp. (strain PAMC 26642) TaxID=1792307 RepID=UPI0007705760|nr:hypothetical protein [Bosea sp. PAMC 26642]AMJ60847.1 hypothetical protein AXW83_11575 [Bosea sp. PAMC 26642]